MKDSWLNQCLAEAWADVGRGSEPSSLALRSRREAAARHSADAL